MLIGIDICSTRNLARTLERSPFLRDEVFSSGEIAYCDGQHHPAQHYSARWAAKEACLKAFGLPVLGCDLTMIEVAVGPEARPTLLIRDPALHQAMQAILRDFAVQISISHEDDYSVAVALVTGTKD
jgi:holo-[acyl-carrier protein] synthase